MILDDGKAFYESKTIWFSVALAMLGAVQESIDLIPPEWHGFTLIVVAALTAGLRVITHRPLK